MIVVDVGCATYQIKFTQDESLRPLLRRFNPELYFGFDIAPGMQDGHTCIEETLCMFSRRAAWTATGSSGVVARGNCTHIDLLDSEETVETFDLGSFLLALPAPVVLKVDVEGAEYPLMWDLHDRGIDERLELALVEWHTGDLANGWERERPPLRCPLEDWH